MRTKPKVGIKIRLIQRFRELWVLFSESSVSQIDCELAKIAKNQSWNFEVLLYEYIITDFPEKLLKAEQL